MKKQHLLQVPKVLTEALDNAGMEVGDVDWLLLHQVRVRGIGPLFFGLMTILHIMSV